MVEEVYNRMKDKGGGGGVAAAAGSSGSGMGAAYGASRREAVPKPTKAKLEIPETNNGAIQCVCGDNRDMGVMIQCEVRGLSETTKPNGGCSCEHTSHADATARTHARASTWRLG